MVLILNFKYYTVHVSIGNTKDHKQQPQYMYLKYRHKGINEMGPHPILVY